jgi:hypothetical protein
MQSIENLTQRLQQSPLQKRLLLIFIVMTVILIRTTLIIQHSSNPMLNWKSQPSNAANVSSGQVPSDSRSTLDPHPITDSDNKNSLPPPSPKTHNFLPEAAGVATAVGAAVIGAPVTAVAAIGLAVWWLLSQWF